MKKSFVILFLINMVIRIFSQGLLPIYPVITEKLGSSKQNNGFLLATSYCMLLISTWLSGKLIPKYTKAKSLLLFSVIPVSISMGLLGAVNNLAFFWTCSLILFFFVGLNISSGLILIGYYSNEKNVGKNFGILGLSNLLGTLIGGIVVGPLLFNLGNYYGFLLFGIFIFCINITAIAIKEPDVEIPKTEKTNLILSRSFLLLIISFVLAVMLIHVFLFSFSLSMKSAGYNIKEISLYSAIGTAIILPIPYYLGKWTYKYSAKKLMLLVYALMILALGLLLLRKTTPIILTAVACMSILAYSGRAIIVALVFPWFSEKEMPMVQAYLGVAAWLAAIVGYIVSGQLLERTNYNVTIVIGIFIGMVALIILQFKINPSNNYSEKN